MAELKLAEIGTAAAKQAELLAVLDAARQHVLDGRIDGILVVGCNRAVIDGSPDACKTIFWTGGVHKLEIIGLATVAQYHSHGL